jgi:hypothetical protein
MTEISSLEKAEQARLSRRRFVGIAGALAGAGLLASATGCKKEEEDPGLGLGAGDVLYLNTFYLVKQVEADFYTRVSANIAVKQFGGLSAAEQAFFQRMRNHEIAHRELLKNLLGSSALAPLEFDFSKIEFGKRTSLIDTAIILEDLGVSAFNGSIHKFSTSTNGREYALVAAKMASVEARHAATVRNMKASGTFAGDDVITYQALDIEHSVSQVVNVIQQFVKTKINSSMLP